MEGVLGLTVIEGVGNAVSASTGELTGVGASEVEGNPRDSSLVIAVLVTSDGRRFLGLMPSFGSSWYGLPGTVMGNRLASRSSSSMSPECGQIFTFT